MEKGEAGVSSGSELMDDVGGANERTNNAPRRRTDGHAVANGSGKRPVDESAEGDSESESIEMEDSGIEQVISSLKSQDKTAKLSVGKRLDASDSESVDEEPANAEDSNAEINVRAANVETRADADQRDTPGAGQNAVDGDSTEKVLPDATNAAGGTDADASGSKDGTAKSSKAGKPHSNTIQKRSKPTSGVVYVSRVPPGMDVGALRSLLGRAGKLGRVWLRPESAEARKERRSLGSSRRRGEFKDGWVEFPKRRDAKRAVALLNGRPMAGATRRGRWGDDLWCLKLLPGYQWSDLVEETCAGARERTLRVKAEIAAARREKAFVEERVAMARRITKNEGEKKPIRHFRQKRAITDREWEEDIDERRARESMKRVDEELETGKARTIDQELVGMLFKKRRTGEAGGKAPR